ncbi:MAG: hypothetical protein SPE66_04835, partial [Bilifractor sp.]|nr:hypothetical protein [Bilifractor sp.]
PVSVNSSHASCARISAMMSAFFVLVIDQPFSAATALIWLIVRADNSDSDNLLSESVSASAAEIIPP